MKIGRNDPCPCGSGKKFKKCCEMKVPKGPSTHKIADAGQMQKAEGLSQLFKSRVSPHAPPVRLSSEEETREPDSSESSSKPPTEEKP